jgi:hypothetical protein
VAKKKKGKMKGGGKGKTGTRGLSKGTCSAGSYFTGANESLYKGGKKGR